MDDRMSDTAESDSLSSLTAPAGAAVNGTGRGHDGEELPVKEAKKTQRRDGIIKAARALVRESGGLGFSMRSLADRAGVSIATPYNLFGSKQSILVAVLDADLAAYQDELAKLKADEIEVLFKAGRLLADMLGREPEFYRNVIGAVASVGPKYRGMVSGPRYLAWKRMLAQATEAGLLSAEVNADAFAVTSGRLTTSVVLEWAHGALSLEELAAHSEYGLALSLLAIATDRSRADLMRRMQSAERKLQHQWRARLIERLRAGELDEASRDVLANELASLNAHLNP
jgi:AcrR family transcriptional regulator